MFKMLCVPNSIVAKMEMSGKARDFGIGCRDSSSRGRGTSMESNSGKNLRVIFTATHIQDCSD